MENDRKTNYNVHNLTFIRNNSYPQRINFDKEHNCFFMMDYYNLLKERKLRDQIEGYTVLVGGYKDENNAVAKRIMGVYSELEEDFQDEQVFQTAAAEQSTTSAHPFLGIIQVYITDYMWKKIINQCVHQVLTIIWSPIKNRLCIALNLFWIRMISYIFIEQLHQKIFVLSSVLRRLEKYIRLRCRLWE